MTTAKNEETSSKAVTTAKIVQHTHENVINGVIYNRVHYYELKFSGKSEEKNKNLEEFANATGYKFDSEMRMTLTDCPDDYHCWCQCMEDYLLTNGYTLTAATNKFFIFSKQ